MMLYMIILVIQLFNLISYNADGTGRYMKSVEPLDRILAWMASGNSLIVEAMGNDGFRCTYSLNGNTLTWLRYGKTELSTLPQAANLDRIGTEQINRA